MAFGSKMPYIQPVKQFDLALQNNNNQVVPLFLSNKGRYVWSDKPFKFEVNNNQLILDSKYENIQIQKSGNRLKSAYLDAINRYFKSNSIYRTSYCLLNHNIILGLN